MYFLFIQNDKIILIIKPHEISIFKNSCEHTLKMVTPVVRELYDCVCKLNAQGKNCTFKSLKEQMPNHSHRDYTLALDLFKDQQSFIESNAMPMPPELKSQVDSMVTLQWATLCQHFNELKKKLEKEFEERLKEARSARDDALDNNELLKRTNQELSSRLQEASKKNNELNVTNENFKEELNKKNFEIGKLQERVKAQETSIKDLKTAFDTIANK